MHSGSAHALQGPSPENDTDETLTAGVELLFRVSSWDTFQRTKFALGIDLGMSSPVSLQAYSLERR